MNLSFYKCMCGGRKTSLGKNQPTNQKITHSNSWTNIYSSISKNEKKNDSVYIVRGVSNCSFIYSLFPSICKDNLVVLNTCFMGSLESCNRIPLFLLFCKMSYFEGRRLKAVHRKYCHNRIVFLSFLVFKS